MERVEILINKLQEQLKQQADAKNMLVTVQMLNNELLQSLQQKNGHASSNVSVVMPYNYTMPAAETSELKEVEEENSQTTSFITQPQPEEEIIEAPVLSDKPVIEKEPEVALEKEIEQPISTQPGIKREHSQWIFDPIEAPTLAHQEKVVYELNESLVSGESSLNDRLKIEKLELANILHDVPIRDLKKAISINDRHRFIQDLFRGDETMYERSIKTINNFENFAEAEFWMQRELKLKLAWDNNNPQVKLFDQLVRRRFA